MKPNFLFIGPGKAGSTWLFRILLQHPECYVPKCKDIYFFDRYYEWGMDWYLSFFSGVNSGVKAIGELSHDYIYSVSAAERIASDLPGVKLIACLRQPIDRTFSQYLHMARNGVACIPFDQALERFPDLIDKSLYYKHLVEYFKRFQRSQISVLFFDDLKFNPKDFAKKVFSLLNLSLIEEINYNPNTLPASRALEVILVARLTKLAADICRDIGFGHFVGIVRNGSLPKLLYKKYDQETRPRLGLKIKNFCCRYLSRTLSVSRT